MKNPFWVGIAAALASQLVLGQSTSHKTKAPPANPGAAVWTPEVLQYLSVQQGSFTMVGLNRLSKAQLEALVNAAKIGTAGDPRKHPLTCGPATPAPDSRVRVLVTVTGDDPQGQRAEEIRQAVAALNGVTLAASASDADRVLHVVIQEQTLGKRTIGFTASYVTATPCVDSAGGKNTDAELKGQLGTFTQPKGSALASDLAGMLQQDLQSLRTSP